jgi:nucleoid DNA-binding protein
MTIYNKKEFRADILAIIERVAGVYIPKKKYVEIEKEIMRHIISLIVKGERVPIGALGTFFLKETLPRVLHLPHIPAGTIGGGRSMLRFKVGSRVKDIDSLQEKIGTKKDGNKKRNARGIKDKKASAGAATKSKAADKQKEPVKGNKRISKRNGKGA